MLINSGGLFMRKFIAGLASAACVLLMTSSVVATDFSSITGKWKTKDDETGEYKSIVELYVASDGTLQGKVIKTLKEPGAVCDKCPGESDYKVNTPVEGMIIVKGVTAVNEKSGTIFDPAKGKKYSVKFWREGKNLMVRGYVAFFYRTQTWYPAD
jgi:uncharacterized protein (DUF2147 family)